MHRLRVWTMAVQTLAIVFLLTASIQAQSDYGSITGFIRDPSGAVIPGAQVTIKNEGTGEERVITANDSGYYVMPNLQPGYYIVTAESHGFKKFVSNHNKLNPNTTLSVDASLVVGNVTETMEVSAMNDVLQTKSAAV